MGESDTGSYCVGIMLVYPEFIIAWSIMNKRSLRKDRKDMAVHIIKKNDNTSDLQFWQQKTPQERINAVEFLRSQYYSLCGYTYHSTNHSNYSV